MNELQRAIHKVARLRQEAEALLEAEAKAEAALNNTPEHRAYKAALPSEPPLRRPRPGSRRLSSDTPPDVTAKSPCPWPSIAWRNRPSS